MARYQWQNLRQFSGMDSSSDPAEIPPDKAILLDGFLPGRQGDLKQFPQFKNVFLPSLFPSGELPFQIASHTFYQGYNNSTANVPDVLLLFGTNLGVYTAPITYIADGFLGRAQYLIGNPTFVGSLPAKNAAYTGTIINRPRTVQYNDETLMARMDGMTPYRFTYEVVAGTPTARLFQVGLPAPTITSVSETAPGTGIFPAGTTRTYVAVWLDEKLRVSSISAPVTHTTAGALVNMEVHFTSPNDPTLAIRWYAVYNTPSNTTGENSGTYYLNATPTGTVFQVPALPNGTAYTFGDDATDAQLVSSEIAANPGDNDPPAAATMVTIYKSRAVFDKFSNRLQVQLSNFNGVTQFAQFASPFVDADANLGTTITVGTDKGDEITGLRTFGAILGIFKRRSIHQIDGDDLLSGYFVRQIHERGCTAPDSIVRCDNQVLFLSDNGVWAISYQDGLTDTYMSSDIEPEFIDPFLNYEGNPFGGSTLIDEPKPLALGFYWQNRYFLGLGPYTLCYDFQSGGWSRTRVWVNSAVVVEQERRPETVFLSSSGLYGLPRGFLFFWNAPNTAQSGYVPPYGTRYIQSRIRTRPADGTNVPRERMKRLRRVTVRGTNDFQGDGMNPLATVTLKAIGTAGQDYEETYSVVRYPTQYPDDTLFVIEPSTAMVGRLLEVDATFNALNLDVREALFEYIPYDGAG